jgi:hypothetical protein
MTGEEHHRLAELASASEPSPVRSDHPLIRTDHPEGDRRRPGPCNPRVDRRNRSSLPAVRQQRQLSGAAEALFPDQRLTSSAEEEYPGTREAEFDLAAAGLWYFAASVVT